MTTPRQGHGIAMACGYVYCCAGFNRALGYDGELASCERFSLIEQKWKNDVPDMSRAQVAITTCAIDKVWIYSFGDRRKMFIER